MDSQSADVTSIKKRKVLVILSSADKLVLSNGKSVKTGFFLNEAFIPIKHLVEKNYEIEFANPNGNEPTFDPISDNIMWFGFRKSEVQKCKELLEKFKQNGKLKNPRPFHSIREEELEDYDGIFIPGGHAPMRDLGKNPDLGRILRHFHERKKPTAAICHGPIALLSAAIKEDKKKPHKPYEEEIWPYHGYTMTMYSNWEETLNEFLWWGRLHHRVQDQMIKAGAKVITRLPMLPNVVCHEELITGQGPSSASLLAKKFTETLEKDQIHVK